MGAGINFWLARRAGHRFYYGWVVVGVAFAANLAVFSFNPVFGLFVTPIEQEFGWDRATLGRALTLGTIVGAAMAPVLGIVIDRIGTRLLMIAFGLLAGVCYALLGGMQAAWQFNLLVAIIYPITWMGVGQMMSSVNVSRWFVRRRGRAMGIVMMGASGGAVVFIPLCTFLIDAVGWRATYVTVGSVAAVVIAVPALLLLVNGPEELGLSGHPELRPLGSGDAAGSRPAAAGTAPASRAARAAADAAALAAETWTLREAARTRCFWLTLLGMMLGTVAVQGYFVHAVPHMEAQGFSRLLASSVWTTFFVTGMVAKFLWGFIIERIGVRRALVLLFCGEAFGLWLLLTARSPTALFVYAVVNGLGHGPYLQLQAMVWADYFGRRSVGRIYGVAQPAIVVCGSMGPWLGGHFFDLSGDYTEFFYLGIGLCLLAVVVFLIAPPPRRHAVPARPATTA